MLSCSYELRVKNTNDELGLPVEDIVAVDVPAKPGQGGTWSPPARGRRSPTTWPSQSLRPPLPLQDKNKESQITW